MAVFECKVCGGKLDVEEGKTTCTCPYCGREQTVSYADDETKINLYNRANNLRRNCDFDRAYLAYQQIVTSFPNEAEAYWGLAICKYGIEYVEDNKTKKSLPTVHRASYTSFLKDEDYLNALKYSDVLSREQYIKEAKEIDEILKNILTISNNEEPYDIFICYKETDNNGDRTLDSVLAQDIYDELTSRDYKVFFSRITLESKIGEEYEPIIFSALNTSKVMLVVTTSSENVNSTWVKNEWSRFLKLKEKDRSKYIVSCYKNMNVYDLPDELSISQGQDLSKLGYMQDLTRGIDKLFDKDIKNKEEYERKRALEEEKREEELRRQEEILEDLRENIEILRDDVIKNIDDNKYLDALETLNNLINKDLKNDKECNSMVEEARDYVLDKANEIASNLECYLDDDGKTFLVAKSLFEFQLDYKDSKYKYSDLLERLRKREYEELNNEIKERNFEPQISKLERLFELDSDFKLYKNVNSLYEVCKLYKDKCKLSIVEEDEKLMGELNFICYDGYTEPKNDYQLSKVKSAKGKLIYGEDKCNKLYHNYQKMIDSYENEVKRKNKIRLGTLIGVTSSLGVILLTSSLLVSFLSVVPNNKQEEVRSLISSRKYEDVLTNLDAYISLKDFNKFKALAKTGKALDDLDYLNAATYMNRENLEVKFSYDPDGGTLSTNNKLNESRNLEYVASKEGETFYGWVVDSYSIDPYNYVANIDLKASYEEIRYSVTWDLGNYVYSENYNESDFVSSYTPNDSFTLNKLSLIGNTFLGWSGSGLDNNVDSFVVSEGSVGNKHFKANFDAKEYNLRVEFSQFHYDFNIYDPEGLLWETEDDGGGYVFNFKFKCFDEIVLPEIIGTNSNQGKNFLGYKDAETYEDFAINRKWTYEEDKTIFAVVENRFLSFYWNEVTMLEQPDGTYKESKTVTRNTDFNYLEYTPADIDGYINPGKQHLRFYELGYYGDHINYKFYYKLDRGNK